MSTPVRFSPRRRIPLSALARRERLRRIDLGANRTLYALAAMVSLLVVVAIGEIAYQVFSGAGTAISHLGLNFFSRAQWAPNFSRFGARAMVIGTLTTSGIALVFAAPLGIAIGLFLSLMAPRRLSAVVGPLVELLAAVPSVIVGLWGLIVLAPVVKSVEPFLHRTLGFIPFFGEPQTSGIGVFTASVVLTVMIVPIIAALSRDLFSTVPRELKEGAEALGATRWEMIRGVVLATTVPGVAAASMLALGRALGEAIAVATVIGAGSAAHSNVFQTGSTLASRIALTFTDASGSKLWVSSLLYLGAALFVIGVATNLLAQRIARRFGHLTNPFPGT